MKRFITDIDRSQSTLFPESLDSCITKDNPDRVLDVFIDELDLANLGVEQIVPCATGESVYYPTVHLKLYVVPDRHGALIRDYPSRLTLLRQTLEQPCIEPSLCSR